MNNILLLFFVLLRYFTLYLFSNFLSLFILLRNFYFVWSLFFPILSSSTLFSYRVISNSVISIRSGKDFWVYEHFRNNKGFPNCIQRRELLGYHWTSFWRLQRMWIDCVYLNLLQSWLSGSIKSLLAMVDLNDIFIFSQSRTSHSVITLLCCIQTLKDLCYPWSSLRIWCLAIQTYIICVVKFPISACIAIKSSADKILSKTVTINLTIIVTRSSFHNQTIISNEIVLSKNNRSSLSNTGYLLVL